MTRVLIVDDEPSLRVLQRLTLEERGYTCDEAAGGAEALELHAASDEQTPSWSVIVLDHRMPGMTGIEVAREIRERGDDTPIVLYSGYIEPSVETQAASLGVRAVDKVDHERLLDIVDELALAA
ncbi:response regulator [Paraconexibacter sp.]|uniref:response regulator n=1 Tax=Paraconexibacter sp. TaxID=2949640 RepID=UPI0035669496